MQPNYTEIGLIVGIVMGLIEVGKYALGLFFAYINKDKDKGDIDAEQKTKIALLEQKLETSLTELFLIRTNHLQHIQDSLEGNAKEHRDIFVILARIEAMLKK
jgi:hypothetical protein